MEVDKFLMEQDTLLLGTSYIIRKGNYIGLFRNKSTIIIKGYEKTEGKFQELSEFPTFFIPLSFEKDLDTEGDYLL